MCSQAVLARRIIGWNSISCQDLKLGSLISCNKEMINMKVIFMQRQHRKTDSGYGKYLLEALKHKDHSVYILY